MEASRFSPEDREVSEIADRIIAEFDRIAFAGMNKILDEVRRQGREIAYTPEEGDDTTSSSVDTNR